MNQLIDVLSNTSDLAFVVNVSGGKDSTRMLGLIREQYPDVPTYCVMADTGFEHVRPVTAAAWSAQIAERFGVSLHVIRNAKKTYLEMVRARGMFPSAQFRQCTSDLKRGPIRKFVRHLPHRVIINCTGIRREESVTRAKQRPWTVDDSVSSRQRTVYNWMPIFDLSKQDVLDWHWTHGIPLHPVYVPEYHRDGTTGGYLRRFSCRVCIFATDTDVRRIHEHDREAFDMVSQLEQEMGFTMKAGRSLVQIVASPARAERNDSQLALFPSRRFAVKRLGVSWDRKTRGV